MVSKNRSVTVSPCIATNVDWIRAIGFPHEGQSHGDLAALNTVEHIAGTAVPERSGWDASRHLQRQGLLWPLPFLCGRDLLPKLL